MKKFHVINIETIMAELMSQEPNQYQIQIIIYIVLKNVGRKYMGLSQKFTLQYWQIRDRNMGSEVSSNIARQVHILEIRSLGSKINSLTLEEFKGVLKLITQFNSSFLKINGWININNKFLLYSTRFQEESKCMATKL